MVREKADSGPLPAGPESASVARLMTQTVLIIDFGSQVTQLIARRLREQGVYCEIVPFQSADAFLAKNKPQAVILSGSPASVTEIAGPRAPQKVFELDLPVLGICYGEQLMCEQLGGKVKSSLSVICVAVLRITALLIFLPRRVALRLWQVASLMW